MLIERGAALNQTAKYALSALMLAFPHGRADIVGILVNAGADTSHWGSGAPGFAGKTALDLSVGRGDRKLVELLQGVPEETQ
jgi:hypothetical protein